MRQDRVIAPRSVTVVDDEYYIRHVLSRAAAEWDYRCQTAGTAEEALELLEKHLTPVVVTDLRMPGHGGVWLVREVRRRWPQVGVIVLTAVQDVGVAKQCLEAGAHHFFLKPIQVDEFQHVLETACHTYHRRRQRARHQRRLEWAVGRQTRRVRQTFLSAVSSLGRMIEERDPYTAGHSQRVRRYALSLARAVGLPDHQRRRLSLAARLHDIGKVAVPESILHKAGPLDDDEMRVVREHPVVAERILRPIIRGRAVLAAVRSHHERPDGTGYPDGLRGAAVPLLARLIAIPDVFDALTSARAYRRALPVPEALEVLRAGAGTQFDPALVSAFLEVAPRLTVAAALST